MGFASEHKALAIIAAVAALGVGVRLTRDRGTVDGLVGTPVADAATRHAPSKAPKDGAQQLPTKRSRAHSSSSSKPTSQPAPAQSSTPITNGTLDRAGYVGNRLDLDGATLAQIESLPGIGPTLGARIVADRAQHGPFLNKEGFNRVRGVGPTLLRRLDSLVTFSGRLTPLPDTAAASAKVTGPTSKPVNGKAQQSGSKKRSKKPQFS